MENNNKKNVQLRKKKVRGIKVLILQNCDLK